MSLVAAFVAFRQSLSAFLPSRVSRACCGSCPGVLAPRHTLSTELLGGKAAGKKHHSAFYRLFVAERWTMHAVGLSVLWFQQEAHRFYEPLERPWYFGRQAPSFADILTTLRVMSAQEQIIRIPDHAHAKEDNPKIPPSNSRLNVRKSN